MQKRYGSAVYAESGGWADIILVMTSRHKASVLEKFKDCAEKVFLLREYARVGGGAEIENPMNGPVFAYPLAMGGIKESISAVVAMRGKME